MCGRNWDGGDRRTLGASPPPSHTAECIFLPPAPPMQPCHNKQHHPTRPSSNPSFPLVRPLHSGSDYDSFHCSLSPCQQPKAGHQHFHSDSYDSHLTGCPVLTLESLQAIPCLQTDLWEMSMGTCPPCSLLFPGWITKSGSNLLLLLVLPLLPF